MSEIRSAKDVMQNEAYQEPKDLIVRKVIARSTMQGLTKYEYCPYCVQRAKRRGEDWKTCKPLWKVTYKSLYQTTQNEGQIIYETEYQCPVCRDGQNRPLVLSPDDFSKVYSRWWKGGYTMGKQQGIKLDPDSIRNAGFENFGE